MLKGLTKKISKKLINNANKLTLKYPITTGMIYRGFSNRDRRRKQYKTSGPRSSTGDKAILLNSRGKRTSKAKRKHHPQVDKEEQYLSFNHLGLLTSLHEYLKVEKIFTPTSIQNESISKILSKQHNFFIGSSTGSGKTLCYLLPIFQFLKLEELMVSGERISDHIGPKLDNEDMKKLPGASDINLPYHYQFMSEKEKKQYLEDVRKRLTGEDLNSQGQKVTMANRPRVMIVLPTRELVQQVTQVAKEIGKHCKLGVLGLGIAGRANQKPRGAHGKTKGIFRREKEELDRGVDIVIGTTSRIELHLNKKSLNLSQLRFIVMDEADTILDAGNVEIASFLMRIVANEEEIEKRGESCRAIFVSATLNGTLNQFIQAIFSDLGDNQPYFKTMEKIIDPGTHLNLSHINHNFAELTDYDKHDQFLEIMGEISIAKKSNETCIVFCNSVASCRSTEYLLRENGYEASSIHGEVPAKARLQNYDRFKKGELDYLVSTDLASRGLDFRNNGYVVNFDFPPSITDYLHRVGRTGRAGRPGTAFSLIRKKDMKNVNMIKESYETGIPLAIGSSSYTMKNKELLKERRKLEAQQKRNSSEYRENRLEQVRRKLQLQDSADNNFVDFKEKPSSQRKKLKGSKRRPESREKKAYKKVLGDLKSIPKSQRHQKTKMVGKLKKKKKKLVKEMQRQKNEGYDY